MRGNSQIVFLLYFLTGFHDITTSISNTQEMSSKLVTFTKNYSKSLLHSNIV